MPDRIVIVGAIVLVGGLLGLLFLIAALRRYRRIHLVRGTLYLSLSAALALGAVGAVLVAMNLFTYTRLTHEQQAAHVTTRELGERRYVVTIQPPNQPARHYELRGDEWQIDARVLKWHALATLVGFDTAYRLERISGRYGNIAQERAAPRTVYPLAEESELDLWSLVRRHHRYVPLVDALYGSAAYVPMAEGAEYEVSVSASGLVVRPANDAARKALGAWK
jgi:hypothetical protein